MFFFFNRQLPTNLGHIYITQTSIMKQPARKEKKTLIINKYFTTKSIFTKVQVRVFRTTYANSCRPRGRELHICNITN